TKSRRIVSSPSQGGADVTVSRTGWLPEWSTAETHTTPALPATSPRERRGKKVPSFPRRGGTRQRRGRGGVIRDPNHTTPASFAGTPLRERSGKMNFPSFPRRGGTRQRRGRGGPRSTPTS